MSRHTKPRTGSDITVFKFGSSVFKFGSSVLRDEDDVPTAVHEIYRAVRDGHKVVAVVSALGSTTDDLLACAKNIADDPDAEAVATLLATGETRAVALLAIALGRAGVPATPFDCHRAGLVTEGDILDASPTALDRGAIEAALRERPVVVIPGFVGRRSDGVLTLLGRGGSDLTALFIAEQLDADCVLVKDVDGIYDRDPKSSGARRYRCVSYEDALALECDIVQPKAIRFAAKRDVTFRVVGIGEASGTVVAATCTDFYPAATGRSRLRVALLGLGTVGLGVYRRLCALSDRYEIVGVAVSDRDKHSNDGVPQHLLSDDPWHIIGRDCDVVVELIGGVTIAADLIASALATGRHVVTANKSVIAQHGQRLESLGRHAGATLSYSAAVGGALPLLERLRALDDVESFEGVLNGTTNFVLDRLAEGVSYADAVGQAQHAGFAEADPTLDLDGTDAAQKLSIAARFGFGSTARCVSQAGVAEHDTELVRRAHQSGRVVRLVATCRRGKHGLEASVELRSLPAHHPLAKIRDADNRVIVSRKDGRREVISGKGAGRWPTTESVFADLDALARHDGLARSVPLLSLAV